MSKDTERSARRDVGVISNTSAGSEKRAPTFNGIEQRINLCREAHGNWPIGGDHFVLSEEEEAFARAHPPRLVFYLWQRHQELCALAREDDRNATYALDMVAKEIGQ